MSEWSGRAAPPRSVSAADHAPTAGPGLQASPGTRPREAWRRFWRGAVEFAGRSAPAEFWWPYLINGALAVAVFAATSLIFTLTLGAMVGVARGFDESTWSAANAGATRIAAVAVALWGLALAVPTAALLVRRLRDAGLSGWLALLALLPVLGVLVVTALALMPTASPATPADDPLPAA